jgi:hypothetical protein
VSFGDPSQTELREMNGYPTEDQPEVNPEAAGTPITAAVVLAMPGADLTKVYIPQAPPYNQAYLDAMALAMKTQGTFFMGRRCVTPEESYKTARDLLALLDIMVYSPPVAQPGGPLFPGWSLPS